MSSEERLQRRIEDLERRVRSQPGDAELLQALVRAYSEAGRFHKAADAMENRLESSEAADWTLVESYCEAARQGGRPERGLELLERLRHQYADRSAFWTLRGRMLEDMGRLEEARREHIRAVEIDPEDAGAIYRHGATLMKLRRDAEAVTAFERCLALDPRMTNARINMGVLLDQMGQPEKAIEAFRQAIGMDPNSVESHCNLGAAYGDLGRKKEAMEEFRRALEIAPDYPPAHFNMGLALMESDPETAMNHLKRAHALDPGNWEIAYNLGLIYFRKGMYDTASRFLQECVDMRPDSVRAMYYLGVAFNKKDQPGRAIECLSRVVELDPGFGPAHFHLGVAYDKKGQSDEARACYKAADRLGGIA